MEYKQNKMATCFRLYQITLIILSATSILEVNCRCRKRRVWQSQIKQSIPRPSQVIEPECPNMSQMKEPQHYIQSKKTPYTTRLNQVIEPEFPNISQMQETQHCIQENKTPHRKQLSEVIEPKFPNQIQKPQCCIHENITPHINRFRYIHNNEVTEPAFPNQIQEPQRCIHENITPLKQLSHIHTSEVTAPEPHMNINTNHVIKMGPTVPCTGVTNIGYTCYLNAALQIIAALYSDKLSNTPPILQNVIRKIGKSTEMITKQYMELFVEKMGEVDEELKKSLTNTEGGSSFGLLKKLHSLYNLLDEYDCSKRYFNKTNDNNIMYMIKDVKPDTVLYISFYDTSKDKNADITEKLSYKDSTNINDMIKCCREIYDDQQHHFSFPKQYSDKGSEALEILRKEDIKQNDTRFLRQEIYAFPNSRICIHLNRFPEARQWIETKVQGTDSVSIKCDPNDNKPPVTFTLHGFLHHNEKLVHATAYVKIDGAWYETNDCKIKLVSDEDAINKSQEAYVFFYKK